MMETNVIADNNTPRPLDAREVEIVQRIVVPMVQERSREPDDAWDRAAKFLRSLSAALPVPVGDALPSEVQRMVERLNRLVILDEVGSDNPLAREAAALLVQLFARAEKAEREYTRTWNQRDAHRRRAEAAETKLEASRALLAEAAEGLGPFADAAGSYDPPENDDTEIAWAHDFTIGSLRRARELVTKLKGALS